MRRGLAALALAGTAALALPPAPAQAHTTLRSSDPAAGATVAAPSAITLTFADPVMVPQVVLTDGDGGRHEAGAARAVDAKVTQAVNGTLPNGTYRVGWRVVSVDGHPVSGTFRFTVKDSTTAAAAPAPAPSTGPAAKASSGGAARWLWVGLAAGAVALVAGGAALARRSRAA
ncbi:copper resistance CopC family protein [Actinomadura macrotermitis]|uniref:CopC domain-containing protein n=1 Tax=Actinomadura macrotermitis TaxID=2585200 RepID=A0A7K0BWW6_9ACTN|nr:hypothetical protein [Actinomadura macrotermitis]